MAGAASARSEQGVSAGHRQSGRGALPADHRSTTADFTLGGWFFHKPRDRAFATACATIQALPVTPEGDLELAREKNMSRADARRRTRETQRAEVAAESGEEVEYAVSTGQTEEPARKPLFKMPNIREDIRLLPSIFRSKPILFLPLGLFAVGLVLFVMIANNSLAPEVANIAGYYIQFFFAPPALFTFFIAGFFAPRASYLVGFIYGLIAGVVWSIAILVVGSAQATDPTQPAVAPADPPILVLNMLVIGILYGTLAAALASWYREFLHGMQERGKQRRVEREVDERAKRAAERQEARKLAKQRPT
jgi:hypothetical protein